MKGNHFHHYTGSLILYGLATTCMNVERFPISERIARRDCKISSFVLVDISSLLVFTHDVKKLKRFNRKSKRNSSFGLLSGFNLFNHFG